MTFGLYLTRLMAVRVLAFILALAGLLQLVDLMDRADEILERGLGVAGMARYAAYRLPLALGPVMPIATLVAALTTFAGLAHGGEIAALRAAGLPLTRLVRWLVPLGLTVAVAAFLLADRIAPWADAAFARWWEEEADERLWFRDGLDVVGIGEVDEDGRLLKEVEVDRRGLDNGLIEIVLARQAVWEQGGWRLEGVTRIPVGGDPQQLERLDWPTRLIPDNTAQLSRRAPLLSTARLTQALRGHWASREAPAALKTRLLHGLAAPFAPLVMILLASPVAWGTRRSGGIPAGMALGLAAGLSYLLVDGILTALGEAGKLPPVMAAWLPHALFACIGGAMLINAEE